MDDSDSLDFLDVPDNWLDQDRKRNAEKSESTGASAEKKSRFNFDDPDSSIQRSGSPDFDGNTFQRSASPDFDGNTFRNISEHFENNTLPRSASPDFENTLHRSASPDFENNTLQRSASPDFENNTIQRSGSPDFDNNTIQRSGSPDFDIPPTSPHSDLPSQTQQQDSDDYFQDNIPSPDSCPDIFYVSDEINDSVVEGVDYAHASSSNQGESVNDTDKPSIALDSIVVSSSDESPAKRVNGTLSRSIKPIQTVTVEIDSEEETGKSNNKHDILNNEPVNSVDLTGEIEKERGQHDIDVIEEKKVPVEDSVDFTQEVIDDLTQEIVEDRHPMEDNVGNTDNSNAVHRVVDPSLPGPSSNVVDITENNARPVAGTSKKPDFVKISSVVRDAKIISGLVSNREMSDIYDKLLEHRDRADRLDYVSSILLDESLNDNQNADASEKTLDIFQEVQMVIKSVPKVDANEVYMMLESLPPLDRVNKVIKQLGGNPQQNVNANNNVTQPSKDPPHPLVLQKTDSNTSIDDPVLNNDPIFKDMRTIAKLFPDSDRNEIYELLGAANRVQQNSAYRIHTVVQEILSSMGYKDENGNLDADHVITVEEEMSEGMLILKRNFAILFLDHPNISVML